MKQAAALEKTAPPSDSVSTLTAAASKLAAASIAKNTWIAYQGPWAGCKTSYGKKGETSRASTIRNWPSTSPACTWPGQLRQRLRW